MYARRSGHRGEAAMDKVVHFEIPVDDRARAKGFYSSVFDWDLDDNDMGGGIVYTSIRTVATDDRQMPTEPGAINGGIMDRTKDTPAPVTPSRWARSTKR
jgi:predicted enzyme related to lactoylglutathione lyase